jgi:hypothetical protein
VLPPVLAHWGVAERAEEVRDWLTLITVDRDVLELVSQLRQLGYPCLLATSTLPVLAPASSACRAPLSQS